ncbi:MAG: Eco57I restriction-modification methylase domain-containing protein [Planctomycetes bacterium]|nr:Eco57I restriction-modification methylase domain-containing protein [Planctomycetota bacterium]
MTAREISDVESSRRRAQAAFDASRSASERNRLGQFATPNALAVEIATYVKTLIGGDTDRVDFGDPAVGSGSFYSATLAVFGPDRIRRAVGIEIDPAVCRAASEHWSPLGLEVLRGDFTRLIAAEGGLKRPNLVLANPPYVRHHHLDRNTKERLHSVTRRLANVDVNGLAGLYVYFMLLATAWLVEKGWAAWLVPSEFMDVNYGAVLKRFLAERVTLIRVHRFDPSETQFDDALVSSAVVVFRKSAPTRGYRAEFTFGGSITAPRESESCAVEMLRDERKWTVHPRTRRVDQRALGGNGDPVLSDFFRIHRGIVTGGNDFFVIERAEAQRRGLPARFLRPVLPSPRHLKATVIECGPDGFPVLDPQLALIDCDLPETAVRAKYPALWDYLQSGNDAGIRERYLVGKRTPWYRQERREPAPFLCTYMGRGADDHRPFRFIWNRSLAVGTNLYLMLYPAGSMRDMLARHPERAREVFDLLNQVTGQELRAAGRVYGGGLHKIEPSELGRVVARTLVERWPELAARRGRLETRGLFPMAAE